MSTESFCFCASSCHVGRGIGREKTVASRRSSMHDRTQMMYVSTASHDCPSRRPWLPNRPSQSAYADSTGSVFSCAVCPRFGLL